MLDRHPRSTFPIERPQQKSVTQHKARTIDERTGAYTHPIFRFPSWLLSAPDPVHTHLLPLLFPCNSPLLPTFGRYAGLQKEAWQ